MSAPSACAVIGSTGMLGRALTRRLCDLGRKVYAVQRRQDPSADDPRATYIYADASEPEAYRQFSGKVGCVIYAAAYKKNIQVHTSEPFTSYFLNEDVLLRFLWSARSSPPPHIVFAGSIYAERPPTIPTKGLFDGYSAAKCAEEYALEAFAKETRTICTFLRVVPTYGPGNDVDPRTANLIPSILQRIHHALNGLEVWGTGQRQLQMVYVDDVVENILKAMESPVHELRHIGNPETLRIDDIVRLAIEASGKDLAITHDETKPDKPSDLYEFDNLVDPVVSFREGIARTHAWMRDTDLYV